MPMHTLNMSLQVGVFMMLAFMLILLIVSGNLKQRVFYFFFLMVLFCFFEVTCDIAIEILCGRTGPVIAIVLRLLDGISYSLVGIEMMMYGYYFNNYLSMKVKVSKKPFYIMKIIAIGNILLAIIASFTQLYSQFDEYNNYIKSDYAWVALVLPLLFIFICMGTTHHYAHVLKRREWVALILFVAVPIPCYLLEIVIEGVYFGYAGAVFTFYIIYINIQSELKYQLREKEAELAENRIAIMLSQIQPHFLYNSLNAIDDLFYYDQEKAHKALYAFSDYLRGNMDSLAQKELIPFFKELEHTREYLWLEELRFEERLQVVYDIGPDNFKLPVLTLQPIVENAVRHGITKKAAGGTVTIRTEENEQYYLIIVTDNGNGFNGANNVVDGAEQLRDGRSHTGIANVRSRLAAMCNGRLKIESTAGTGTTAIIEIPKNKESLM